MVTRKTIKSTPTRRGLQTAEEPKTVRDVLKLRKLPHDVETKTNFSRAAHRHRKSSRNAFFERLTEYLAMQQMVIKIYEFILNKAKKPQKDLKLFKTLDSIFHSKIEHTAHIERLLLELGGDPHHLGKVRHSKPTLFTGIVQLVADPRSSLWQCMEGLLVTELSSYEDLVLLRDLALQSTQLVDQLHVELLKENSHVSHIRQLIRKNLIDEARLLH